MIDIKKSNGARLKAARKASGYKINEAAEVLGVSRNTLSSYELNKTVPKATTLLKMAKLYDIDVNEMFKVQSGKGKEKPESLYEKSKIYVKLMVLKSLESDIKNSIQGPDEYYEAKYKRMLNDFINSPIMAGRLAPIQDKIEGDNEGFFD